jgi:hypothetical protein
MSFPLGFLYNDDGGDGPVTGGRITEDGEQRLTEDGSERVIE